jgi:hypothetical protein
MTAAGGAGSSSSELQQSGAKPDAEYVALFIATAGNKAYSAIVYATALSINDQMEATVARCSRAADVQEPWMSWVAAWVAHSLY